MGVAEMSWLPADIEEPTIEGGNTMIIKEQTHLLADAEEKVALKQVHLKKKKENKRKRSDKEQIPFKKSMPSVNDFKGMICSMLESFYQFFLLLLSLLGLSSVYHRKSP
jgi:hypothetical protein